MATKSKSSDLGKLLVSLRSFTDNLPSESEKQELQSDLAQIIDFLSDIRRNVATMPSQEQGAQMSKALMTLAEFVEKGRSNPSLAAILGLPSPRLVRSKSVKYTDDEQFKARQLLDELQNLPIDHMKSRLQDDILVTLRTLQAMAANLGIRSVQRMNRDVLEHQVASKIANFRGYQGLRAGTES